MSATNPLTTRNNTVSFKQFFPKSNPIKFLPESCRSGTYQTLSARILQVLYISDKPVRFCQIRQFLQIHTFSSKVLLGFRHFLPSYFHDLAFSSKLLPRSGIFFQHLPKFRHFLQDLARSCKIRHFVPRSSKIPARIMYLSSKILEDKSDRFLQKMYGSSTGVLL